MIGLKENVILGKLIPAGTGMKKYRNIAIEKEVEELVEETAEATEEVHSDYDLDEMI